MNETQRLESLLAGGNGGSVTLPRRDAQELAQKLKVRGNPGAAARLMERLNSPGDVDLEAEEAKSLLEQLRESGRAWVFGSTEARELSSLKAPEPEAAPEPETQPESEPELIQPPAPEPEAEAVLESEPAPVAEPEPDPTAVAEPEPEPEPKPEPQQKQGFFSRLFGKTNE
jgi:outer membrane biosynthesis protein TonB